MCHYYYNGVGKRYVMLEPSLEPHEKEPEVACYCTKCKQEVYFGEYTFDGMCPDCFEEVINQRLEYDRDGLGSELGFNVVMQNG